MDDQDRTERISEKLRRLVGLIDNHPAIDDFPEMFGYRIRSLTLGTHLVGDEAAQIDRFADAFGVKVVHRAPHPPESEDAGARYTCVETTIDGVVFELQCRTEDYEKATGKTVPVPLTAEQLAEVKYWSETPFAHESTEGGAQ